MATCDGHHVEICLGGLVIDEQFFAWDEMCLTHPGSARTGPFHDGKNKLRDEQAQVLRYPAGEIRLNDCPDVLAAVQQNVRDCDS